MSELISSFSTTIQRFLSFLENVFASNYCILIIIFASLLLKSYILYQFLRNKPKNTIIRTSWFLLIAVLFCAMIEDVAWIVKLLRTILLPLMDYRIQRFIIRIAWALVPIRYNALALFLERSVGNHKKILIHQKVLIFLTGLISLTFFVHSTRSVEWGVKRNFLIILSSNFCSLKRIGNS